MSWYAAHVVMYLRFKDGVQSKHYVQENVVLVEATTRDQVLSKATEKALADYAGDSDGNLSCDGRPVTWELVGVRKYISLDDDDERPASGTEVTYLHYALMSESDLAALMRGEDVRVDFDGDARLPASAVR